MFAKSFSRLVQRRTPARLGWLAVAFTVVAWLGWSLSAAGVSWAQRQSGRVQPAQPAATPRARALRGRANRLSAAKKVTPAATSALPVFDWRAPVPNAPEPLFASGIWAGAAFAVEEKEGPKRADQPDKAMEYFLQKRLPEGETTLPMERYFTAMEAARALPLHTTTDDRLYTRQMLREAGTEQQQLGTWTPLGPGNIGGRTRAILIHPQTPEIMYAAGVAGGVWKSTNAGQSWTPLDDLMANLAVCSLAFDPKNPDVIYAGTGEGFFNADGVRGAGIFKTTNAGQSWTRLASTGGNNANFYAVNDLIVSHNNSNRIYAATGTGVWRSLDAGETWARVLSLTTTGGCLDLAARTNQPTDSLLVTCGNLVQGTIYRNPEAETAATWTAVLSESGMGRSALAVAPANQNVVYAIGVALAGTYSNALHAVFRSDDGGATWAARVRNSDATTNKLSTAILSNPLSATVTDCQTGTGNSFSGQAWYDLTLAVDPLDENRVWAGGIDIARSDDGGRTWGIAGLVYEGGSNELIYSKPNQLHPDQHTIVFHPQYNGTTNQQMFVGNDGGVWRTDNARATTATGGRALCTPNANAVKWTPLNNNYAVTQFYHGSVFPDGKSYFGGAQDNGTSLGTDTDGPNKWKLIFLADGGYSAVDPTDARTLYVSTQSAGFRRSTDGGATFSSATLGLSLTAAQFITPLLMDPSNPRRLYVGGDAINRTEDGMANWTSGGSLRTLSGTTDTLTALAVAPTDANVALFGMNDGFIIRTTRALALSLSAPLAVATERVIRPRTGNVSWLTFDPNDQNIAYATYSTFGGTHVWRSANGGEAWSALDGTGTGALPDIPVHCLVVDPANSARLYLGTDLGVYVSVNGGGSWAVENTGFANVVTESLALNVVDGVTSLYAFTHGRGAYRVTLNMSGCNFALGQTDRTVAASGSELNVAVNVKPGGCNWKAASNVPWISLQPGSGGTESGTVNLKVGTNTSFAPRVGTVAIAGRSFTVRQAGAADVDAPTLRITTPATAIVNTTSGAINLIGTATDNDRVASVTYRTDRGVSGTAAGTISWSVAGLPLLAGRNVISVTALDAAGNVSTVASVTVNSVPSTILATVAGSGVVGFDRDNVPALSAGLTRPYRIAFDGVGNLYIADDSGQRVRRVAPNGVITTIAGTGVGGFSGDGGPATAAQLALPSQVAIDKDGNLYIADYNNNRIRKITAATGIISTVAGTGTSGFSGDGGQATAAQLNLPDSVGVGKDGDLYIADTSNNRIRKVALATGVITTVAGTGTAGFSGDGGLATAASLSSPQDVAFDSAGDLYIAASGSGRVRKVTLSTGIITTVAGNGSSVFNGDGLPALNTAFGTISAIAIDSANNLYINDRTNVRFRVVNAADQTVSTLVGGGTLGFSPDNSGAIGARLNAIGLAFGPNGQFYFADGNNNRVRTILPTVAGDVSAPQVQITAPTAAATFTTNSNPLTLSGTATDNQRVTAVRWSNDRGGEGQASGTDNWTAADIPLRAGLNTLTIVAWDQNGNAGSAQLAVTYSAEQIVISVAGTGVIANTGDGGPGTAATFFQPRGVAVDSQGNILVADTQNRRVRRIGVNGMISAFAGTGLLGSGGDGGLAVEATLNFPNFVIVDKDDNAYISDQFNNRIRKVTPDGKISTIAGTGVGFGGYDGDGGPATQATFNAQTGIALDKDGNLFVADRLNHRIRRIDGRTGIITTVAGSGLVGFSGDGGAATQADLNLPTGVAVDGAGNLYIADTGNQRIRRVTLADGKIATLAGRGTAGFSGDGGPATAALVNLAYPATLTCDASGDLYFADRLNHRIRKITISTGVITTVAGTGVAGYNGDGTAPTGTQLNAPTSVAFDRAGNLVIADSGNNRVRVVRAASSVLALSTVSAASFLPANGLAAEQIAAAFGEKLATGTVLADTVPLPLALGGTTVRVRDSLGVERLAPLFFVAANQINYQVPSGTASGLATVTVTNGNGEVTSGSVTIGSVAPGLFAANANGAGPAAAVALRRTASGQDSFEPVVRFDAASNRFVTVPLELGPTGEQVFLVLFGTGIRGLSNLNNVSATVGGVAVPVLFAGSLSGLIGADQVNLTLDRSLIGRGEVDVVLTVDGKPSNAVRVNIK